MEDILSSSIFSSENQRRWLTTLVCGHLLLEAKRRPYREAADYIRRPPGLLFCRKGQVTMSNLNPLA